MALPLFGDRDAEGAAGFGIDRLHVQQLVAFHQQQALAGMRGRDRHFQRVAGAIAGPVQCQLDLVRTRVEAAILVVPAPAGAERIAHHQAGVRILNVDPVLAPLHREIEARSGFTRIHRPGLDLLEAAGEVVVPAALIVVPPVVVAVLAHQDDLQALGRAGCALGVHAHELEAGPGIGGGPFAVVEQRPQPDQRIGRPQHPLQAAVHAAPAAFVQAAGHQRGDRRHRARLFGKLDVLLQPALFVQFGIDHVARLARQFYRRIAEEMVGHAFDGMLVNGERQRRAEPVAGRGGTVEIGAGDLQPQRFARHQPRRRAVQLEFHPLGQELLDPQRHSLHRLAAARVGAELHLPAPGRRVCGDLPLHPVIPLRAGLQPGLEESPPIRLLQPREERLGIGLLRTALAGQHRPAIVVAQQRRYPHRLARPVQVTPGPGEHIEPRLPAPGHRELRQVKRRLVERQQRHVAALAGHQHVRRVQGVIEHRVAVAVGLAAIHRLALAIQHPQGDPGVGGPALQRGGVHEQPLPVGPGVQADVAHGEERGLELALERPGPLHHREVETRLLQLGDVLHRQVGQQPLVAPAAEHEAVDVHRLGHARQRRAPAPAGVQVPAAAAPAALVLVEEARHVALAHPQEFNVHLGHVERHHRQPAAAACRQHAALRGEAGQRRQVTGVDGAPGVFPKLGTVGRGETAGYGDRVLAVGFGVREPQGAVVLVQRPAAFLRCRSFESDQPVEVLGRHQRLRELQHQRQSVAPLVSPCPGKAEAFDLGTLRLDRLAAGRGQLARRVTRARRQGQRERQQQRHG